MVWRYLAIGPGGRSQRGQLAAESAADARAVLRAIGLRVLEVKHVRRVWPAGLGLVSGRLRRARLACKADCFDALSTMLGAGIALAEAIAALAESTARKATREMLRGLHEHVRAGGSLAEAMRRHPDWFDDLDVAIIDAGERTDPQAAIQAVSQRQERAQDLWSRLIGALTYPMLVLIVGIAVVAYLSTVTLPRLVAILAQAQVEIPALTMGVMTVGRAITAWWPLALPVAVVSAFAGPRLIASLIRRIGGRGMARMAPRVVRHVLLARTCGAIAELTRSGVPLSEALRITAPMSRGPFGNDLGRSLREGAARIERGESPSAALAEDHWFDASARMIVATGQDSGELPMLLARLGQRYERSSRRMIERLAAMAEPSMILFLALLVGVVVMAAILPMLRLQEVLR